MVVAGVVLVAMAFGLVLSPPAGIGPMVAPDDAELVVGRALLSLGCVGAVIGLVWMFRIERSARDPEGRRSSWRSRH
jgi:hypothetical protein